MDKLRKFIRLPRSERLLYLRVAAWLIVVKIGLFLLPFERLRRLIAPLGPFGKHAHSEDVRVIIQAIERVGRFLTFLGINCLPQALAGHRLLRQQGFVVQLKIGVLKTRDNRLSAHAWLEYEGRVILGDLRNLGQFTAFPPLDIAKR